MRCVCKCGRMHGPGRACEEKSPPSAVQAKERRACGRRGIPVFATTRSATELFRNRSAERFGFSHGRNRNDPTTNHAHSTIDSSVSHFPAVLQPVLNARHLIGSTRSQTPSLSTASQTPPRPTHTHLSLGPHASAHTNTQTNERQRRSDAGRKAAATSDCPAQRQSDTYGLAFVSISIALTPIRSVSSHASK